jgi:acid phosphatase type 7
MRVWPPATIVLSLVLSVTYAGYANAQRGKLLGILLAVGDIAYCGDETNDRKTSAIVKTQLEDAAGTPTKILVLGDLAYPRGTTEQFACFHESWGKHKEHMLPVPGNHEYNAPFAAPYFSYFSDDPAVPIVNQRGSNKGYYAVNFPYAERGPWRLYGLNAYVKGEKVPETGNKKTSEANQKKADAAAFNAQIAWLREDLKTNPHRCILAFWHPFMSSSGYHGHGDSHHKAAGLKDGTLMARAFEALYAQRASLLLTAHDHHFEQFKKQDANRRARPNEGIRSFIVGTGGGKLYNRSDKGEQLGAGQKRAANSEAYDPLWFGVLKLKLYDAGYEWEFMRAPEDPKLKLAVVTLPVTSEDCNMRPVPGKK